MSEQTRYRPWSYERPPFGAFGVLSAVGERLVCHVCGRDYLNLQTHVSLTHGLSAREYKDLFRLRRETPLWAASMSRKLTRSNERRMREDPAHLDAMTAAARTVVVGRHNEPLSEATRALKAEQQRVRASALSPKERAVIASRLQASLAVAREDPEWQRRRFAVQSATMRRVRTEKHWSTPSGEDNGSAKLTWEKVRRIRALAAAGRAYSAIAAEIPGATSSNIHLIVHRRTWRNDPLEVR